MLRGPQLFDLFSGEPFPHPTALGADHYVPFLKSKPGELEALANMPSPVRQRLTPFIDVEVEGKGTGEPPGRSRLPRMPAHLQTIFGTQPFFLDCGSMAPGQRLRVGQGRARGEVAAAEYILVECERLRLNFVPVVRSGASPALVDLVKRTTDGGRGACLRIAIGDGAFRNGGIAAEILGWLERTRTEPAVTDLALDLRYIGVDPGFGSRHLARLLGSIPTPREWRSVIVTGTVIPPNLSGYERDSIRVLTRHEWLLWDELKRFGLERMPTFGDYGIQNPEKLVGGGPNMTANLRYSTVDSVVIVRGHAVAGDPQQYRELCKWLIDRPEFRGSGFSQGDLRIQQCADGLGTVGNQNTWRGAGASHHLHAMVEEFSARRSARQLRVTSEETISPLGESLDDGTDSEKTS